MFRSGLLIACTSAVLAAAEIPQGAHLLLKMQNSITTKSAQVGDYVYLQTATPLAANGGIVVPVGTYVQGVVAHVKRPGRVKGRAELSLKLETFTLPDGRVLRISAHIDSVEGGETGQKVKDEEGTIQQGSSIGTDATRIGIITGLAAPTGVGVGATMTSRTISRQDGVTTVGTSGVGNVVRGGLIGAGIGATVGGAVTLITRGQDAVLASGTPLDIVFDRPVQIE